MDSKAAGSQFDQSQFEVSNFTVPFLQLFKADLYSLVIPVITMIATFATYVGQAHSYRLSIHTENPVIDPCHETGVGGFKSVLFYVWCVENSPLPSYLFLRGASVFDLLREQITMVFWMMPRLIQSQPNFQDVAFDKISYLTTGKVSLDRVNDFLNDVRISISLLRRSETLT